MSTGTDSETIYSEDVQRRLDTHLDEVEDVLRRSGMGRVERATIVDELANQVSDMLSARFGGRDAWSVADLESVLSDLDPPASYGDGGATEEASGDGRVADPGFDDEGVRGGGEGGGWHRLSVIAFVWALSIVMLPVTWPLRVAGFGSVVLLPLVLIGVTGLIGSVVLGFMAIGELKARPAGRRERGMEMAVFAAIFGPVVLIMAAGVAVMMALGSYTGVRMVGTAEFSFTLVPIAALIVVTLVTLAFAWAYGSRVYRYAYDVKKGRGLFGAGALSWVLLLMAVFPGGEFVSTGGGRLFVLALVLLLLGAVFGFVFRRRAYGWISGVLCLLGVMLLVSSQMGVVQ